MGRRIETLRRSLVDPALRVTAGECLEHATGFRRVIFHVGDSRHILHHWPAATRHETDVHSHRWPYFSMVLAGSIEVVGYAPVEDGPANSSGCGRLYRRYRHVLAHDSMDAPVCMEPLGTARLIEVRRRVLGRHATHGGGHAEIHSVVAAKPATMTYFHPGPTVTLQSLVFTVDPKPIDGPAVVRARRLEPQEIADTLDMARDVAGA